MVSCLYFVVGIVTISLFKFKLYWFGTKGKRRYASSKARLKCAIYPRSQYMVMWALGRFKRYGR